MNKLTSNFISILNKCYRKNIESVDIFFNSYNLNLLNFLKKRGFILRFEKLSFKKIRVLFPKRKHEPSKVVDCEALYKQKIFKPLRKIEMISHGSHHKYASINELKRFYLKTGVIFILHTNKGLLTTSEAIKKKVGGKLLFKIHI